MPAPIQQLQQLRLDLAAQFPERREIIEGTLYALLSSEGILLLGPPGSAKSALVRSIAQAFSGRYFERLLTKFSTPEELFGPVSLKALEQDRYARVVTDKLPEAEFAFVDEVFRGNSAILNSLLTLVAERIFHNDGAPVSCPFVSMFGAANDLPEGRELEALFDRFLFRFEVQYLLRPTNFRSVVAAPEPKASVALSMADLRAAQGEALAVAVPDPTIDALIAIRDACRAEGIVASDRRWKKSLKAVQASAHLAGQASTTPEDLFILVDALWREPKERGKVAHLVGQLAARCPRRPRKSSTPRERPRRAWPRFAPPTARRTSPKPPRPWMSFARNRRSSRSSGARRSARHPDHRRRAAGDHAAPHRTRPRRQRRPQLALNSLVPPGLAPRHRGRLTRLRRPS